VMPSLWLVTSTASELVLL